MSKNKSEKGAHGGGQSRPEIMFGKGFKQEKDALENKKKPSEARDNKSSKDKNTGKGHHGS